MQEAPFEKVTDPLTAIKRRWMFVGGELASLYATGKAPQVKQTS